MKLGQSVKIRGSKCPYCGHTLSGAAGVTDDPDAAPRPKPNDFTACIECNNVLVFDHKLGLRKPRYEEERQAAQNVSLQLLRAAIAGMHRAKSGAKLAVDKSQAKP